MKSAYTVLGIPGNVDKEEIDEAFQKASRHYSRERLADNPDLVDKLNEIRTAHKILSNAQMREAHDRKLRQSIASPVIRPVAVEQREGFGPTTLLKIMAVVAVAIFAIGGLLAHAREKAREAQAQQELAQKKLDEEAAEREAHEKEVADQARAARDRLAENRERQLRAESLVEANFNSIVETQRQANAARQAQAARNAELREERRKEFEAQRKLAEYRQILRQR